jgi:hypothetical protein
MLSLWLLTIGSLACSNYWRGKERYQCQVVIDTVYDGESALLVTISEERLGDKEDTILKYGADTYQKHNDGYSAMDWLNAPSSSDLSSNIEVAQECTR